MKKIAFVFMLAFSVPAFMSYTLPETSVVAVESMKIVNDTDNDVRIHTGSGVVNLTSGGGSTSITCEVGNKIYTAPNGSKKDLIFEVTSDMCGETVKLSKYLD